MYLSSSTLFNKSQPKKEEKKRTIINRIMRAYFIVGGVERDIKAKLWTYHSEVFGKLHFVDKNLKRHAANLDSEIS